MMSLLALVIVAVASVCVEGHKKMRIVDLTHALDPELVKWPGFPAFNFTILSRGPSGHGYWYESNYFGTPEHGGTHLDAPSHFYEGSWRTSQIPIEHLIGPGVIIDVSDKASSNPDYRVTIQDLKKWEKKYGEIPTGAVVIMNSGWYKHYPDKKLAFGTDDPTDPSTFHFPAFHEEAADWLVTHRHIHVIGVDTPSTDYGQSTNFPVHQILGKANVPGLENVAALNKIPPSGTTIYCAAIKLFGGSGGPTRTIATFMEDGVSAGVRHCPNILMLLFLSVLLY